MPITNPRNGTYTDLKTIINSYNWRENVRSQNGPVLPNVYQFSEVGDRRGIQDPAIVIQAFILRGIETSGGSVALRARMGLVFHCYSKTPQVCEKLADGLWNVLYATDDENGTRNYVSSTMTTLRKVIPVGYNDTPAHMEIDHGKPTGWWVQIVRGEAETQQSNS